MNNTLGMLYYSIFSDYVYRQDCNFCYTNAPYLEKIDKNKRFEIIQQIVNQIFEKSIPQYIRRYMTPKLDPIAFNQAVGKFSRDIYGQRRLEARLIGLENINKQQIQEIKQYKDYGFKVNSSNPYIHRTASIFLYWFSILKPFSLEIFQLPQHSEKLSILCAYFNEYITYFLVQAALESTSIQLHIENNWEYFKDFLADLHFRNLSRSSLEFFLASYQLVRK
ncbi:MAG: hypothetical protein ACTTJ7_08740 [Treponema sp.]